MSHAPVFVAPSASCGFSRDRIRASLGCFFNAPAMVRRGRGAALPCVGSVGEDAFAAVDQGMDG